MTEYIVIVFHHGGVLVKDEDGLLTYVNGRVDNPGSVDVDFVNLCDIDMIFKDYGYETCKRILWLDPAYTDLELGLKPLKTDSDINVMCEAALSNGNEVHIYFDNCISTAVIVQSDEEEKDEGEKDEEEKDEEKKDEEEKDGEKKDEEEKDEEKHEVEEESSDFADEDIEEDDEYGFILEDEFGDVDSEDSGHKMKEIPKKKAEKKTSEKNDVGQPREKNDEAVQSMSFEEVGYDYKSEELQTPPSSEDQVLEVIQNV